MGSFVDHNGAPLSDRRERDWSLGHRRLDSAVADDGGERSTIRDVPLSRTCSNTCLGAAAQGRAGVRLNEHLAHPDGEVVFRHACKMGLEGIVSKRLGSVYRSGRSPDWLKMKNPTAPAVKREAEEDWGKKGWW
jgi:hypothetical protein